MVYISDIYILAHNAAMSRKIGARQKESAQTSDRPVCAFLLKIWRKEKNEKDVLLLASIEYQDGIKNLRGQILNICEIL